MVLKAERFQVIDELRKVHPLTWLIKIGEVSRSGYYKWRKTQSKRSLRLEKNLWIKEHILAIHKIHPYYGYKRMTRALFREGIVVNHKRVRRLMRELGVTSVIRKKRPFYGRRGSVVFKNVLNREFYAESMFQKLVTDITYVRIGDTFAYLSAVLDLYNNEIVAWEVSSRNDLELVHNTLNQLRDKSFEKGALLHSDQGNCHDNACIESFFSHLKTEKLYLVSLKTTEEAYIAIQEYIEFYNTDRFQEKFNGLSPIEYREKAAA
jgi:putative transposase